jgi:hypothetical protein
MAQQKDIKYYITTYTSFSHNHVIAILSSNEANYRFDMLQTEQEYSRFQVYSNLRAFQMLREAAAENNGNSFTLEYGSI